MYHNQLKDILRSKILGAIKKADSTSYGPKVIAVDDRTLTLLNSCLSNSEICTGGISGIVHINEPVNPQPGTEVIYFVTPTPQVVARICQVFSSKGQQSSRGRSQNSATTTSPAAYSACHILFTYELDDTLFRQLQTSIPAQLLKTLNELYVNFRVVEPLVYRTESSSQTFYNLFSPQVPERAAMEMEQIARQMVSLCAAMQISPLIRYHQPDYEYNTCTLSRQLAMLFQIEMDKFLTNHQDFEKTTDGQTVFLILDRSVDLYTPFLHEFTYQAMANDLLDIKDGRLYSYEAETGQGVVQKEAVLDEKDPIWMDCRHKHIVDVKEYIEKKQAELEKQNKTMTKKGEKVSVSHLRTVVGSMKEYERELGQFTAHHTMMHECFVRFGQGQLPDLANIEQILATGKTAEGEIMRNLEMEMFPLLDNDSISSMDKLRLLMLHFTAKNGTMCSADRQKLLQIARLGSKHREAVENLAALGFQFDKVPPPVPAPVGEDNLLGRLKQSFRARPEEPTVDDAYTLSRYVPNLKKVIEDQLSGRLDVNEYPLVKPPKDTKALQSAVPRKSLRTVKATWAHPAGGGAGGMMGAGGSSASLSADMRRIPSQSSASGGRLFVFVVGGITYSEVRTIYELSASFGWDVYLGSTHVFTPRAFLHELSGLSEVPGGSPAGPSSTVASTAASAGTPSSLASSKRGFFSSRFGSGSPSKSTATSPPISSPNSNYSSPHPDYDSTTGSHTSSMNSMRPAVGSYAKSGSGAQSPASYERQTPSPNSKYGPSSVASSPVPPSSRRQPPPMSSSNSYDSQPSASGQRPQRQHYYSSPSPLSADFQAYPSRNTTQMPPPGSSSAYASESSGLANSFSRMGMHEAGGTMGRSSPQRNYPHSTSGGSAYADQAQRRPVAQSSTSPLRPGSGPDQRTYNNAGSYGQPPSGSAGGSVRIYGHSSAGSQSQKMPASTSSKKSGFLNRLF